MKYGLVPVVERVQFLTLKEFVNLTSGEVFDAAIAELKLIPVNCSLYNLGPITNNSPPNNKVTVPNAKNNFVSMRSKVYRSINKKFDTTVSIS